MLSVSPDADAVTAAGSLADALVQRLRARRRTPLGPATLRGEIIDPKCYLGAMKPGGGKTHRACATLCIRGGIPPMLVVRGSDASETFYLLTDPQGGPIVEPLVPYIGEPVRISGEVVQEEDLLIFRVDPASIGRL
jgi:hypothetical protein